jgi:NAD(P)-dependent dehydrogenase (short-subunit alcohol dehydrogenase family)
MDAMSNLFGNKVVLITGGSSGIGRATALVFAKEGAKVVVAARRKTEGEETASMIKKAGGDVCFVQTDVSKASEVEAMVTMCVGTYGGLDYAFNNAGIEGTPLVSTTNYDEETWDQVIDINLKGVWLCMKYEIPPMLKRGRGAIVNMSSVAGLRGGRTMGVAYFASKHGVIGLTKTSALEYALQGIRINAVCPAWIETAMANRVFCYDEAIGKQAPETLPIGRIGKPEEVAAVVLWLCSDAASFVTGHALPIDGGILAQ